MSDDTHVTDVGRAVHKGPDLICIRRTISTVPDEAFFGGFRYAPTVKLLTCREKYVSTRKGGCEPEQRVLTP